MDKDTRELVAKELIKIPKGYVGINDPVSPEMLERQLKRARVQADSIAPLIEAEAKRQERERIYDWGNKPCPHQAQRAKDKKRFCDMCWDSLKQPSLSEERICPTCKGNTKYFESIGRDKCPTCKDTGII